MKLLRNEEWFQLHSEFSHLAMRCGTEVLGIQHLFPPYRTRYNEVEKLLGLLPKSFTTADTREADRLRKMQFRGLRYAVKACLRRYDAAGKIAAMKVNTVTGKYKHTILTGGMSAKTTAIENLLHDLRHGEGGADLSEEIQLLELTSWVTGLDETNNAFIRSVNKRADEAAARPPVRRLQKVRAEMDHYYVYMMNLVDAQLMAISKTTPAGKTLPTAGDGKILHFAGTINSYILHYKAILKGRHTRKAKRNTEGGEPE
jgi:hypothetical protein